MQTKALMRLGVASWLWLAGGAICRPGVAPATESECARCNATAVRTFFISPRVLDCESTELTTAERRLRSRVERCARRFGCGDATATSDALMTALRRAIDGLKPAMCGNTGETEHGAGWGDAIDADHILGLVGLADAPIAPADAASYDEIAAFCAGSSEYRTPPPLPVLPQAAALPDWCAEDQAYRQLATVCGPPRAVFVDAQAASDHVDGTSVRPFTSIAAALASCRGGGLCHVLIGPGAYAESIQVSPCTILEGGIQLSNGTATRGAVRPRVEGGIRITGPSIVARLDIRDPNSALQSDGDVLVSDAVLRGGYEGGSSAWAATGPRICRTSIAAGYSAFDIAWHSTRLWIAGSALAACYQGGALSWGSSDLKVIDSTVYAGYSAVGTSWGSTDVEVRGSRLGARYAAVDIHIAPDENDVFPATFNVEVTDNRIVAGTLPDNDPSLRIHVADNVRQ